MGRKNFVIFICVTALVPLLLSSCNPDCKEIEIQKVEWVTRYEDYVEYKDTIEEVKEPVDTLVSYSITEHRTKVENKKNSSGEVVGSTHVHYITIKNNNKSYSNRFAVKLTGKEYEESTGRWKDLNKTTGYVSVAPQGTYTFTISHPSWWRNDASGYNENNVSIRILQEPIGIYRTNMFCKRVKRKKLRRIDRLVISDTIVNDCEGDIEALTEKYNTIKEIFERLKNENLITTD